MLDSTIVVGGLVAALTLFYLLLARPVHPSNSLGNVRGPSTWNFLSGHMATIFDGADERLRWIKQYGRVVRFRSYLGENRLYVTDPKALRTILIQRPYDFVKSVPARSRTVQIFGNGLVFAEGADHVRQKRAMQAAFGWDHVKRLQPIFQSQADKLCDRLIGVIDDTATSGASGPRGLEPTTTDGTLIDLTSWTTRCTMDIIGLAGFDYAFHDLDAVRDADAFAELFRRMLRPRIVTFWRLAKVALSVAFPFLAHLPTRSAKALQAGVALMQAEGQKMLDARKAQAATGELDGKRDLLSLIVKANLEGSDKDSMSDDEVMYQITTFMLAGHDTSAVALSWTLLHLSKDRAMQTKLRQEIRAAKDVAAKEGRTDLSADEILDLPYLDIIVRETMRLHPPIYYTIREAKQDDAIPLTDPITGRDGNVIRTIAVPKGTTLHLGIRSLHLSTELFGADAAEYRPERWNEPGMDKLETKGFTMWSSLMTFLGGPRGCIGFRFALLEYKTVLATLIDRLEFRERDLGGTTFTERSNIVTRMCVVGEEDKGYQLPLRVSRAEPARAPRRNSWHSA